MNGKSSPLKNKVVMVTGGTGSFGNQFVHSVLRGHQPKKLIIFSRDELKLVIEQHGGKNQSGVSAKTNYLLAGDEAGPSKLDKAKKLGVKQQWSWSYFLTTERASANPKVVGHGAPYKK